MELQIKKISIIFCTSFGIGYLTKFPGTLASLIILPIIWYLKITFNFLTLLNLLLIFIFFSFIFVKISINNIKNKDPNYIIIDEYIGQFVTLLFCEQTIINFFLGFILFRFFDIFKPFPINYFDKLNNAFGLIMDDIVAGLFAAFFIYIIINLIQIFS